MQPLKQVLGDGMVAYPRQRRRKDETVATEGEGIVANLLQRVGQHQTLKLLVGKHIGTDDVVFRCIVFVVGISARHNPAIREIQRPLGISPFTQHPHVRAVNRAFQCQVTLISQVVCVKQALQVSCRNGHRLSCRHADRRCQQRDCQNDYCNTMSHNLRFYL